MEKTETAIFAAGCFWGVQFLIDQQDGVLKTRVGYTGGALENPSYEQVCKGATGHLEAVEITFDPSQIPYETLVKLFFEIHDFTQTDGQGPDRGNQYLSAIFFTNEAQKKIAESVITKLTSMGYNVATALHPATLFWPAEDYHQNYYVKTKGNPYCHRRHKIF